MKYAIVTGSASGLGNAIFKKLKNDGIKVFGVDVQNSPTTDYICDVSDEKILIEIQKKISLVTDRIDYLFNCAGMLTIGCPLLIRNTPLSQLKGIMKFNFESVFLMSKIFLPMLQKSDLASITNISSEQSFIPERGFMPYAVSKGAINIFTKCLAQELLKDKILVTAFALGSIRTNILKSYVNEDEEEKCFVEKQKQMPLGLMESDNIANFIVDFVKNNKYATGEIIKIDSGLSLC